MPPADRAALVVGMPAVSVVATLAVGWVAGRMSPFLLTAGAFVGVIVVSLALQATVALGAGITDAALVRMAFLSALPGAIFPIIPILCPTASLRARAFGAMAQTGNVGTALGPPLFNAALIGVGPIGLLAPTLALCLLGIGLALAIWRRFGASEASASSAR